MSDLGKRGWPNSMKLHENIGLDELLLDPVSFVFILSSFCFYRGGGGGPILGSQSTTSSYFSEGNSVSFPERCSV